MMQTKNTETTALTSAEAILHEKLPTIVWLIPTSIILLTTILIIWASVSTVDIINHATGEVVTDERVKKIQPKALGTIDEILVHNGQHVKKGDLLIQLDTKVASASYTQSALEFSSLREKYLRLNTISLCLQNKMKGKDCIASFVAPQDMKPSQVKKAYLVFTAQWSHYQEKLDLLESKVEVAEKSAQNYSDEMNENEKLIPMYEEHLTRLKELKKHNMASQRQLDEMQEKYLIQMQKVNRQKRFQAKAVADLLVAKTELLVYKKEFNEQIETELSDTEKKLNVQRNESSKLKRELDEKSLYSPIDGVVNNLKVTTIGGVVQPAEELMEIIPKDTPLDVKLKVLNKDIGFVYVGQKVRVKLDTFNFTKYGALNGHIIRVSDAATLDDKKGLVYEAYVRLDKDSIRVGQKDVKLIPGMTAVADILTGERKLIEYILTPIMRYKDEVMRER
ncbi:HlyD family type I secretion periplasmic adaptor subunit [Hydrogenovibrio sp. JE_KL2]|uniref:HlyD family type I secretion periplasmic adaptor subunit n=1 Tax=Hydrogenovibrio sp. JE_KL2 TaxID=2651188 RepID=UPI0015621100|nr:HlyD family type I secretion periplasmic adaptor subunit [Hydrogenovibrio sp. JE_KL2]